MISVIMLAAMVLGVSITVTAWILARHAPALPRPPSTYPEITSPNPDLPTASDRWSMETEHELNPHTQFNHIGCRVCGPGPLKKHELPSQYDHVFYKDVEFSDSYGKWKKRISTTNPRGAQVVSSEIESSEYHTPMLDMDFPVRVVETSTPGHHHLYLDKPILWKDYKKVLIALRDAGLIEEGFADVSIQRGSTHLRPPWVEKVQS